MLTLGIESSCDETAIALVENGSVLAQALSSQVALHALFGGVVPELASRRHYAVLSQLCTQVFEGIPQTIQNVDCVAVARGPGLLGSLLVGLGFAKGLSFALNKPLVGVNHLHAHILGAGLEHKLSFPCIGILLSGGHTYTYYCSSYTQCEILGRTIDDAVGEVFDKIGKMLGMPYPAGKSIELFAQEGYKIIERENKEIPSLFTMPYTKIKTMDYSFSGLKTQALQYIQKNPNCILSKKNISPQENSHCAIFCASLTHTISQTIANKVLLALEHCNDTALPYTSLVLGGGVAANSYIRTALKQVATKYSCDFFVPSMPLCTDNAIIIAYLGEQLYSAGYTHTTSLSAIPRGQIVPTDYAHSHINSTT